MSTKLVKDLGCAVFLRLIIIYYSQRKLNIVRIH